MLSCDEISDLHAFFGNNLAVIERICGLKESLDRLPISESSFSGLWFEYYLEPLEANEDRFLIKKLGLFDSILCGIVEGNFNLERIKNIILGEGTLSLFEKAEFFRFLQFD